MDVLVLVDKQRATSDEQFHEDFSENLKQTENGSYVTRLPLKVDHPVLPENRYLAEARLRATTKRLEKIGKLKGYHQIMQERIEKFWNLFCRTNWRKCTLRTTLNRN